MDAIDTQAITDRLFAEHPYLAGCPLPPLADSGRCGVCGAFVAADAPRALYTVPLTTAQLPIVLCPDHTGDADVALDG